MDSFRMLWLSYVDGEDGDASKEGGIARKDIMNIIMDWLGTPYYFGGMTDRGIDCTAFVQRVFQETNKIMLPRTAAEQYTLGMKVDDMSKLKFGDMIFFHTRRSVYASHVGIYLGDNLFAHASSRYGVTVSSLQSTYYNNRFIGGRRLSASDMVKLGMNNRNGEDLH
jgi:cell wall-associated NlpC family hydrolase